MFLIVLGWETDLFLRRPKILIDVDKLPVMDNERKGLSVYLDELERKEPQLRINTRVLRNDRRIHSAVPLE
jgi:hypothetical protein